MLYKPVNLVYTPCMMTVSEFKLIGVTNPENSLSPIDAAVIVVTLCAPKSLILHIKGHSTNLA